MKTASQLPAASTLTGDEKIWADQGAATVSVTPEQIKAFATAGVVKFQSATTQVIDSDVAMDAGKSLLVNAEDGTPMTLIDVEDGPEPQVRVGDARAPLRLRHRTTAGRNIPVDLENIYGDQTEERLAYLSDLAPANGSYRFTSDGKFQLLNSTTGKWHLLTVTGADGKAALAVSAGGED